MKNKQGISLIVLVITIIVMTILAASVVITLSNTGIINKANDAVEKTNINEVRQLATLTWSEEFMDGKRGDTLKNAVLESLKDYTDKYDIVVDDKGVTVSKKGETSGVEDPETTPAKYFSFKYDTTNKTAMLTGIKDEYKDLTNQTEVGELSGELDDFTTGDVNNYKYSTAIITEDGTKITELVLPGKVIGPDGETYTVTHLSPAAFAIDDSAYGINSEITKIVTPDTMVDLGDAFTFYGCNAMTELIINNGTIPERSVGNGSWNGGRGLISLTLGSGVTSINYVAFMGCDKLSNIIIHKGLNNIAAMAFLGCTSLTDVYYTGSAEDWAKITIEYSNECLTNATIHYNYVAE